jgi:hypothetical protein
LTQAQIHPYLQSTMPDCPKCGFALSRPPDDVQEWFRCDHCKIPLRMPSETTKAIYVASIVLSVSASCGALFYLLPYVSRLLGINVEFGFAFFPAPAIIGVWLGRFVWYAKLAGPRVYDPYSSLNLSNDKKLRGS